LTQPWLILAQVRASDSRLGNGNGLFEPEESLTIVVTVRNSGNIGADNTQAVLRALDDAGWVSDSAAGLGSIPPAGQAANTAHPFIYVLGEMPSDSTADLGLLLTADDYVTICYFSLWLSSSSGIGAERERVPLQTTLERIRPSPTTRAAWVRYGLARRGQVDLALYDAGGRRLATLAQGRFEPGWYRVRLDAPELSQGVYFCRLDLDADGTPRRLTQKVLIAR
jgi:hypothetical protein